MFAELSVDAAAAEASASQTAPALGIVVGDVVIRARTAADEGLLTQAIRVERAHAALSGGFALGHNLPAAFFPTC